MLLIVRHSERLDEVDAASFKLHVISESQKAVRHVKFISGDTPITQTGVEIAQEGGKFLSRYFLQAVERGKIPTRTPTVRIFASRLLRCVQTAYEIAKVLNVSVIYLSKGIAWTALAVQESEERGHPYHFLSIDELNARYCPGIHFEDCDLPAHPYHIPTDDWLQAFGRVNQLPLLMPQDTRLSFSAAAGSSTESMSDDSCVINIVVAHRETIRNFLDERRRLPYCCIAPMKVKTHTGKVIEDGNGRKYQKVKKDDFQVKAIYSPNGELFQSFLPSDDEQE
jgi:hypothetical protein